MTTSSPTPALSAKNMPLQGIAWMIVSTLMFVTVTAIIRNLGGTLPPAQSAFIRYFFGLLLLSPALFQLVKTPLPASLIRMGAIRGFAHSLGVILWFFAMARISMAEVTAIGYVTPICVTIGAAIFLGEKLRARRIMGVLAGLLGALIILRPGFSETSIGQFAQLGAAPLFAISYLMTKSMTGKTSPKNVVVLLTIFCTLFLLPFALLDWQTPTFTDLGWLLLTAMCATFGHYAMTRALAAAPISVTQPITFLQLVWATIVGVVLFDEGVDPFVILGGVIIVSAASFISYRENKLMKSPITPPASATKLQ
ncbi:MAG: DMT family transporter [Rhizobiaceae bacterium]